MDPDKALLETELAALVAKHGADGAVLCLFARRADGNADMVCVTHGKVPKVDALTAALKRRATNLGGKVGSAVASLIRNRH